MNLSDSARHAISQIIEKGIEKSAEKLAKMSRTHWSMQTVSVSAGLGERLLATLKEDSQEYYGAYFRMPGGVMMVLISKDSGEKIVGAYLGPQLQRMKAVPNLEQEVLAEISNVLVNAVAAQFADACHSGFLVSAPEMSKGTKKFLYGEILKKFPQADTNLAVSSYVHMSSTSLSTDCSMFIFLDQNLTGRVLNALDEDF